MQSAEKMGFCPNKGGGSFATSTFCQYSPKQSFGRWDYQDLLDSECTNPTTKKIQQKKVDNNILQMGQFSRGEVKLFPQNAFQDSL